MKRILSNAHGRARRRWLVAALLAACLVLIFPGISEAHAILRHSDPTANAILRAAPSHVRLWFSEELNPSLSTAEVLNAANQQRVDRHDAHLLAGDTLEMDVSLEPHLPPAVYVVIYRTVSNDDGHVLGGSFRFTVARPDGSVPTVSGSGTTRQNAPGISTLSGSSSGQLDGLTLFNLIMVTLVELGAVFWVGAQFWSLLVLRPAAEDHAELAALHQQTQARFERRFSIPLLLMLLLANGGVLIGQAVTLTDGDVRAAFAPPLLASLVNSGSFGTYWLMRVITISLLLGLALYQVQLTAPARRLASLLSRTQLLLGLALFIAMTMSSHAAAAGPSSRVYAVAADWLHLVAAALWVGGMISIATTYLPVLRRLPVAERAHALVTVLPYYSPWAVVGILIMAVTGPLSATVALSSWEQLLSTAYGRVLTVKVLLVGAMLLTSAFHVFVLRPRLQREALKYAYAITRLEAVQQAPVAASVSSDHEAATPLPIPRRLVQEVKLREGRLASLGRHLTTMLRYEPLLGVAVLVCVGLLNVFAGTLTLSPIASPTTRPGPTALVSSFHATARTADGAFTVTLTVTPNQAGPNTFTVSAVDNHTSKPTTEVGVTLYTTQLDMDMGTDTVNLQPVGKGHFSAQGDLTMSGHWEIRVQIRTVEKTLHEATIRLLTALW